MEYITKRAFEDMDGSSHEPGEHVNLDDQNPDTARLQHAGYIEPVVPEVVENGDTVPDRNRI